MNAFEKALGEITQGGVLSEKEMESAMRVIMEDGAPEDQLADFLVRLSDRGETVEEITGAARVMREKAITIKAPEDAVDCCGTGGDASGTYNISTAVALVAAACGVPVAKHGNRAASSKSGAADVLEALGVNLSMNQMALESALKEINFCFLMAPRHHEAMKYVVPVRKKLGRRTIFNLLGPLSNPANTKHQLIGVFDRKWVRPMAETLARLGTTRAWVVHGSDGLDEITITGDTHVAILDNGEIAETTLTPEDFGLPRARPEGLKGGDARRNAAALQALLEGEASAYRDVVVANAAAVLSIHGNSSYLKEDVKKAAEAIDTKKALGVLNSYIALSQKAEAA